MTIEQSFEDFCQVHVYRACLAEIVFAREMARERTCGLRREMTCGFTREMTCGFGREMTCGLGKEMTCGLRREMTCGFTRERTCGFTSHLATSQLSDLNHSSANFGEAFVVD